MLAPGRRAAAAAAHLRPAHHPGPAPQAGLDPRARPAATRPRGQHRRHVRRPARTRIPAGDARAGAAARRSRARSCPGNNDYYAPRPKNPIRYFVPETDRRHGPQLPWPALAGGDGRRRLGRPHPRPRHAQGAVTVVGRAGRHRRPAPARARYGRIAGPGRRRTPTVRLGVTHSPEPGLLDAFAADGYDLVLAGHTHGGQVRMPFGAGAIVTNCGIDLRRARWLHRWDDARCGFHVSRRARHQPVRAGPLRLPPGGDPAHPGAAPVSSDLRWPGMLARLHRGVAQLGSALRSGRRGRRFKSCHPDHVFPQVTAPPRRGLPHLRGPPPARIAQRIDNKRVLDPLHEVRRNVGVDAQRRRSRRWVLRATGFAAVPYG